MFPMAFSLYAVWMERSPVFEEGKRREESKKEREERRKGRGWQRLTLPHRYQCSTISACGLNDRVRNGAGCTPTALATNTHLHVSYSPLFLVICFRRICLTHTHFQHARTPASPHHAYRFSEGISPRPLVPVRCTHCCASTSGLSSWWSASGLTPFLGWGVSSGGGLPT